MGISISEKYKKYCRPKLGEILSSIRLDKVYHKASGDYLYYYDNDGTEIRVLDFLGGYGASLFGHNHAALLKVALSNFEEQVPFNNQASCRKYAALLAERLNSLLHERTGKNYITVFANTGTECVEAAIKHAELSHCNIIDKIHKDIRKSIFQIKNELRDGRAAFSGDFYKMIQERISCPPGAGCNAMFDAVISHNYNQLGAPSRFLSLENSFHGKTTGSVKLTYNEKFRAPFGRIGLDVIHLEPGNPGAVMTALEDSSVKYFAPGMDADGKIYLEEKKHVNISAMFIEPLQGEGGINVIQKDFLEFCRDVTSRNNIPLIFDEIQSGMGRTGTFMFSEQRGVVPDYYLLSKSLGGGLSKISAVMIRDELYDENFDMIHSSTFAEDGHSARIALAALDLLEGDGIMMKCAEKGGYLIEGLKKIQSGYSDVIREVRGAGLMLGIDFRSQAESASAGIRTLSTQDLLGYVIAGYLLHEHNIRVAPTLSNNATIRIEPSAYISFEDCDRFLSGIRRLCEILNNHNIYELSRFIAGAERPGESGGIKSYKSEIKRNGAFPDRRRVAFMGHFIKSEDLILWDRGYEGFTKEQLDYYMDKTYRLIGPQIEKEVTVKSLTGEEVNLTFIGIFLNSKIIADHMFRNDMGFIRQRVEEAVEIASECGAAVIGFGGYSSIVTNNCTDVVTDSIALTSGNSFTTAMGIEAMIKAAAEAGIDFSSSCLAAVGANGNICSIYSAIIAEKVPRVILIGRAGKENRLKDVASEIYVNAFMHIQKTKRLYPSGNGYVHPDIQGIARAIYGTNAVKKLLSGYPGVENIGPWLLEHISEEMEEDAPVEMTSDLNRIREANLIVGASNSAESVIFPEMIGKGPVVICDIAVPNDTDESVKRERDDVYVIQGGVVKLPHNPDFSIGGIPLDPGESYACMAETVLLGLAGIDEHYSYGRINKERVKNITDIAATHGFKLARSKIERSY